MRTRMNTDARRAQLIAFGRRHFAHHAFDAVSMEEMARRAGVSKGLIYKYFGGRRGFFIATVRAISAEVVSLFQMDSSLSFDEALDTMLRRFLRFAHENAEIYRLLVQTGFGADVDTQAELDTVRQEAVGQIFERLGRTDPAPLEYLAVFGWVTAVEHSTAKWLDMPEVDLEDILRLHATTLSHTAMMLLPRSEKMSGDGDGVFIEGKEGDVVECRDTRTPLDEVFDGKNAPDQSFFLNPAVTGGDQ